MSRTRSTSRAESAADLVVRAVQPNVNIQSSTIIRASSPDKMSETSKTGVYAVRAQEVVSIHRGELERQDFGMAGLLGLACVITCVFTSVLTTLFTGLSSGGVSSFSRPSYRAEPSSSSSTTSEQS